MQSTTNPSPRRRWNAQSRTCRHTKLATLLTLSELISWRVGASQTAPEASELGMGTGDLPTAWSQGVIVNLFKAGDTAARELQDHPGINLPQDVYKHAQAHGVPCTCTRLRRRSEKKILHNLFVLTRILQEAGKANKTVCVLSGRAQSV
jgi:hypothetical protein